MTSETAQPQGQASANAAGACPVCGFEGRRVFFEASGVPVHVGLQWPSVEAARACPRGDIRLVRCERCGFIANAAFDPELMAYAGQYENALHHSPLFREYADALAQRLVDQYELHGRDLVEIGCGDGQFLQLLVRLGKNRGHGFDPSLPDDIEDGATVAGATLHRRVFDERDRNQPADFICCRQVLEHIDDPVGFMRGIHDIIGGRRETVVFFEVPDFAFALRNLSMWDIIYEHCSYFGPHALTQTFERAGFEKLDLRSYYGGTFIGIEARPAAAGDAEATSSDSVDAAEDFAQAWPAKLDGWKKTLDAVRSSGRPAVLWGAGARGVSFLNMTGAEDAIAGVVDLNPRKHGKHMAGTGHAIIPPDRLRDLQPGTVILTNPMYRDEISAQLDELGVAAEILLA